MPATSYSTDPCFVVHIASAQTRTDEKRIANIMFNARGRRLPSTPTSFEFLIVIRVGRKEKKRARHQLPTAATTY